MLMAPVSFAPNMEATVRLAPRGATKPPTEPDAWTIVDDKLYLNYNTKVRTEWGKDKPGYIQKADKNWVNIKDTK